MLKTFLPIFFYSLLAICILQFGKLQVDQRKRGYNINEYGLSYGNAANGRPDLVSVQYSRWLTGYVYYEDIFTPPPSGQFEYSIIETDTPVYKSDGTTVIGSLHAEKTIYH